MKCSILHFNVFWNGVYSLYSIVQNTKKSVFCNIIPRFRSFLCLSTAMLREKNTFWFAPLIVDQHCYNIPMQQISYHNCFAVIKIFLKLGMHGTRWISRVLPCINPWCAMIEWRHWRPVWICYCISVDVELGDVVFWVTINSNLTQNLAQKGGKSVTEMINI